MTALLMQSSVEAAPTRDILALLGVIVAIVVVGLLIVGRMKKRLESNVGEETPAGFTLSDLRQLHRQGRMTDEEFAKAKARVIEGSKRKTLETDAPAEVVGEDPGDAPAK